MTDQIHPKVADEPLKMTTQIHVGQYFTMPWGKDGVDEWEVVSFDDIFIRIRVIQCSPRIGTYLDIGAQYTLRKVFDLGGTQTWEIPEAQMKRSTSQLLLEFQNGRLVGLDLDS
jgi:hypothetical protein